MKLATWNLQRPAEPLGRRKNRLQAVLREINADIWVLTETVQTLPVLDGFHVAHTEGRDRPGEADECWASVWSRYPIVRRLPTADPIRTLAVRIESPIGPLIVFGTVLPWLGSQWRGLPSADGVAFAAAVAAQVADWRSVADANPDAELVVAGDLNQDFAAKHYYGSPRNRACLEDALGAAGLKVLSAGASDPVLRHAPDRASVDHICAPAAATRWQSAPLSSWPERPAPDKGLSDHFGICVDVRAG